MQIVGENEDLFAFKINYNEVESAQGYEGTKLFNGNISETYWRSSSDNIKRKYGYSYDALNRLLSAVYQKPDSNIPVTNMYNESMSYDKNGNILTLQRTGDLDADFEISGAFVIDDLLYRYHETKANQLMKVTDNSQVSLGFKDDTDEDTSDQEDDYEYDENGNLKADTNKGIEKITYNHLNLPIEIRFSNGSKILYLYNAAGQKVSKEVNNTEYSIITDYLNGFQYVNQVLNFFPHAEGYVNVEGTNEEGYHFFYVYNYTDHLGNIRVSYGFDPDTQTLKTLEENHYYPFGLKHTNYNTYKRKFAKEEEPIDPPPGTLGTDYKIKQVLIGEMVAYKYKYNGKEWQDELGLNFYDYGARNYDPAIGRWMNIDPLAEKYHSSTSYSYVLNNPLYYIDSDGLEPTPYEAALMAAHVYGGSGKLAGGWSKSTLNKFNKYDINSGLQSSMYERMKGDGTKEYAYVYAGTNDFKDVKDDLIQAFGVSKQYDQAIEIAKDVSVGLRDREVTFIGHSLGGGLSNLSSYVTGRTSITFNPAWISQLTLNKVKKANFYESGNHRTNYVHENDPLNTFQEIQGWKIGLKELGETIELDGDWYDSYINGHFIAEMIDAFIDNGLNYEHIPVEREIPYLDRFLETDLMKDNGIYGPEN